MEALRKLVQEAERRSTSLVDTLNAMLAEGTARMEFVPNPGKQEGFRLVVDGDVPGDGNESRSVEAGSDGGSKRVRKRRGSQSR